jgi:hypothetical protein
MRASATARLRAMVKRIATTYVVVRPQPIASIAGWTTPNVTKNKARA